MEEEATLHIGYRTILGKGAMISANKSISIGPFSYLGRNSHITDCNDLVVASDEDALIIEPTDVGTHCWIGENSIVGKGTKMGDEVILEANSNVSGIIPPRVVLSGNPAKVIKNNVLWKK